MIARWAAVATTQPPENGAYWGWGPGLEPDILEWYGAGFCHEAIGVVGGITHWMPIEVPNAPS